MTVPLGEGDLRYQFLAYHDAVRHDGPAPELAEVVDGEAGPASLILIAYEAS